MKLTTATIARTTKPAEAPTATLEDVIREAKARINMAREEAVAAGVSYAGNLYDSNERSRENLTGTVAAMEAGVPLPAGFTWRTADNKDVPMTAQDLVGLAGAMLQHVNAAYVKSWELKAKIDAATSKEEIEAVNW